MSNLGDIKSTFELFDDWEDKYRFLIELGKDLPQFEEHLRQEEHLVRGCQSQVWLLHEWDGDQLQLRIDSDAHIVRGLASIVIAALGGQSAAAVTAFDVDALFTELQLMAHLSPTRGNGLRAMVQRVKQIAQARLDASH